MTNIPQIQAARPELERVTRDICNTLVRHGATIDPDLVITCCDGELSVTMTKKVPGQTIISVPHSLLVPYDEFTLALEAHDLVIRSRSKKVTPVQAELMDKMLTLYNMTGKIRMLRAHSIWMTSQDRPEMLLALLKGRQGKNIETISTILSNKAFGDDFAISTFFKERLLGCRLEQNNRKKTRMLMPVIDFINHHFRGAPFRNSYPPMNDGPGTLFLAQSTPVEGSNECFASYGALDALDTLLYYGFIDETAPFVRSVPLTLELNGIGTIRIDAMGGRVKKNVLPAELANMHFYTPVIRREADGRTVVLSHLFIPQQNAIRSMRRVLRYAISLLDDSMDQNKQNEVINNCEMQIIDKNKKFYSSLLGELEKLNVHETVAESMTRKLCTTQSTKIGLYESFIL